MLSLLAMLAGLELAPEMGALERDLLVTAVRDCPAVGAMYFFYRQVKQEIADLRQEIKDARGRDSVRQQAFDAIRDHRIARLEGDAGIPDRLIRDISTSPEGVPI